MQKEYSGTEEQINFKDKIKVLYNKYILGKRFNPLVLEEKLKIKRR